MRCHDFHLTGYEVRRFGAEIMLHLAEDYPPRPREDSHIRFADVEFFNDTRGFSYWAYISHACRVVGVAPETVRPFEWIEEAFSESYGLMFPEQLVTPIGYFVFRR